MPAIPFARGPFVINPLGNNPLYFPRIRQAVDKVQGMMQVRFGRTIMPKSPRVLSK